ncbi:hypothetical protein M406DRAFT_41759 [Cryphonectria parasitica EP155]|uniref:VLRF1 domain-containing protein n=1 Tax=Cryphonectria parasitica (strain ATCC 38755 / EP155) TaxID=660469 RepID=A0A9P4Y280_CRYP1|nr:uncharacterized protein M406DRAFT_41759 [Cryphonectria parasitica EP155]KAF3765128.1 hypothetical protein M406DRAFT_41759 [Cryphonectria parasitica EP155]
MDGIAKKPQEDILRRPLYIYDLPEEVLNTLTFKADTENQEQQDFETSSPPQIPSERSPTPTVPAAVGAQACSLCGLTFATVLDQRGHQKSDLHHYNLKQKLRGHKPVTEADFEKLIGDLDESLSGSDSDESEDDEDGDKNDSTLTALLKKQATLADKGKDGGGGEEEWGRGKKRGTGKPPMMWFGSPVLPANNYFGIYRVLFTNEELAKEDQILETLRKRQLPPLALPKVAKDGSLPPIAYTGPHIFLCMIGGGHFAAMVVSLAPRQTKNGPGPMNREATVLAHKTFHRYTTRRKQGGSQSANDNAKGNAHSAGSSLRRYNEQALVDDVRQLLSDWKGLLDTSDLLFIRATGMTNRRTLFGPYEGQVLRANDPRIRGYPFSTRRATQNELMRSFIELTRLKVKEIAPVDPNAAPEAATRQQATTSKPAKPAPPKLTEEEETALLHTQQLQALIRRSKLPALLSYLKTNGLTPAFCFQPADANHHAPTPLHLAAAQNSAPLVVGLLTRGGADPTLPNKDGKMAFELAGERGTRDAFRVARHELGEEAWDWDAARVPAAMKREDVEKREERERKDADRKEAERRKAEEERLRHEGPKVSDIGKRKGGSVLGAGADKSAEEKRQEEVRGLTPEQKMRLERERRARAAEERLRRMQGGGGT